MPTAVLFALAPLSAAAAARLELSRTVDRAGVAVTFDDGPHPEGTPAVLEVLEAAGVKAMFFVVGEQVRKRPELVERIASSGHVVALHGNRHRLALRLRARELEEDLRRGLGAIEDACGVPARWHRPPYGIYSPALLRAAREAGLTPLLWSRWGKDWRKLTTPARIASRATREARAGDVILLHDADFYSSRGSHRRTARALPLILTELNRRGLGTVLPV